MNLCTHLHSLPTYFLFFTGSRGGRGSKKRRTLEEDLEDVEEEEEVMPARSTARTRSKPKTVAAKNPRQPHVRKALHLWTNTDYLALREENPYATERSPQVRHPHFFTNDQERIYKEIYLHKNYKVVPQH